MANQPIDAVVTWVDGRDPVWATKRGQYFEMTGANEDLMPGRFDSENEILYCVGSLLKFAPYLRKIHIVTDNQTPPIFDVLRAEFGDHVDKIVMVDHTKIFAGYEEYLPVFNAYSIETLLWRVPDLAENFIFLNDDFAIVKPTEPEDFFRDGLPVLRGTWMRTAKVDTIKAIQKFVDRYTEKFKANRRVSYKSGQILGFRHVAPTKRFFWHDHTPFPFRRSVSAKFFAENEQVLRHNLSFRGRDPSQFCTMALSSAVELRAGNPNVEPLKLVYVKASKKPEQKQLAYLKRKISKADNTDAKFFCAQALADVHPDARRYAFDWLGQTIFGKSMV